MFTFLRLRHVVVVAVVSLTAVSLVHQVSWGYTGPVIDPPCASCVRYTTPGPSGSTIIHNDCAYVVCAVGEECSAFNYPDPNYPGRDTSGRHLPRAGRPQLMEGF